MRESRGLHISRLRFLDVEGMKKGLKAEVRVGKRKLTLIKEVNGSVAEDEGVVGMSEAAAGVGAVMRVPVDLPDSEGESLCSGVVCGRVNKEIWDLAFERLHAFKSGVKTHTGRSLIGEQTECADPEAEMPKAKPG